MFVPTASASFSDGLGVVGVLAKPGEEQIAALMRPIG